MDDSIKIEVMVAKLTETGDSTWGIELQNIYNRLVADAALSNEKVNDWKSLDNEMPETNKWVLLLESKIKARPTKTQLSNHGQQAHYELRSSMPYIIQ